MAEAIEQPAPPPSWTEPLKADPELAQYIDKIQEKDLITFAKSKINLEKRLGDSVYLKDDPGIVKQKLQEKGLLPKALEKYEIKKPEGLPEGAWSEQLEAKAHEWAKKHGLSQEALNDALGLHLETIGSFGQAVQTDRAAAAEKIKAQLDKDGVTVEQFDAALARFRDDPVNGWDEATRELLSKSGWADHPGLNLAIYKIVKDSGQFDTRNDGGATMSEEAAEQIVAEARDIQQNPQNPKYKLYHSNDRATVDFVDGLYKKAYGDKEVIANEFQPKIIDRTV